VTKIVITLAASGLCVPLTAQWLSYPTPGIPRTIDGKPDFSAPTPRTRDGNPDLSGLWEASTEGATYAPTAGGLLLSPELVDIGARFKGGLPFRPWARDLKNARQADNSKDRPTAKCLPTGVLQGHTFPMPRKIVQVPGLVVILSEWDTAYRQIFTDGRPLPVDPQPSFNGYSSGRWGGDTLVRTIGFQDGLWADETGTPITEKARITERFRRLNFGKLEIEVTVDDAKAYTGPWTVKLNQSFKPDTDLLETICLENERDAPHLLGK
jgi:hypothetical protein